MTTSVHAQLILLNGQRAGRAALACGIAFIITLISIFTPTDKLKLPSPHNEAEMKTQGSPRFCVERFHSLLDEQISRCLNTGLDLRKNKEGAQEVTRV